MIYLDNNATTRPSDGVVRAVSEAMTDRWQNPSSVHRAGQAVRRGIELARASVARLIGASAREIVFTSGGTESIQLAVRGRIDAWPGERPPVIVSTAIEHAAIRDLLEDLESRAVIERRLIPLGADGAVNADALPDLLDLRVALVSVQWANNETGAVQPIERIGSLCRAAGVAFHCDATQWVGKMPTDVAALPIDLLTFSAHKFHGPKGVGALYVRRGVRLTPQTQGSQELGRRAGTENVPGIFGFGVAAEEAATWLSDEAARDRLRSLRDRLEAGILERVPDAVVNAPREPGARLWNTTNIGFPHLEAEALLMLLSEQGLCASAGAACSSGSLDPSPVLLAMGVPEPIAHGSIRLSLSRETTAEEIEAAIDVVSRSVERLRSSTSAAV